MRTRPPLPGGDGRVDHSGLQPFLESVARGGLGEVSSLSEELDVYLKDLASVAPDGLHPDASLAYWINLYNASAVRLGIEAWMSGRDSVLRVRGRFRRPVATVAGEELSLDDIEHGKVRRFKDPRIHGALVCGALSCPSLRASPFTESDLDSQLDDQLRSFLSGGGAVSDGDGGVRLSRVFLWYGSDFVRPHRMPTFLPSSRARVARALRPWLPEELASAEVVGYQDYDWGLGCSVG
ncbi:MAG: DUF547 domain-containing protein [Acidimicrobiia bacterium]|nr:DUF547 domain-containing protein [Acidimicrobiia bacterium]